MSATIEHTRIDDTVELANAIAAEGGTIRAWRNGRPLVVLPHGRAGMLVGVDYLIPALGYDDREAFAPYHLTGR